MKGAARRHIEHHRTSRIGWLRAAVLGANDGVVSTASLIAGVSAAHVARDAILLTGLAGLVAGAMSMAAGEYVSVHSQADTENADIARERTELKEDPAAELRELTAIYVGRGLPYTLAHEVAAQLMNHDALGAHARDELGISEAFSAAASGTGVSCKLCCRRRAAARGGMARLRASTLALGDRHIDRIPGWSGCCRCASRRRQPIRRGVARRILGSAGHGRDRPPRIVVSIRLKCRRP